MYICNIMQYHAMGKASRLRFHMVQESWEKRGWHTTSNAADQMTNWKLGTRMNTMHTIKDEQMNG